MNWTIDGASIPGLFNVYDESGHKIASCLSEERAWLIVAVPDLLAALEELLAAREMRSRVGLWPVKFPHTGRSAKEPKSAARNRFEVWYTRATCRVIKAEEQAHAAIADARGGEEAEA